MEKNLKTQFTIKTFINFMAFLAVIFVGIALILKKFLNPGELTTALETIAQIISYAIVGIYAFSYARSKRNLLFIIIWIVAVVLIIISYI